MLRAFATFSPFMQRNRRAGGTADVAATPLYLFRLITGADKRHALTSTITTLAVALASTFLQRQPLAQLLIVMAMPLLLAFLLGAASRLLPARADRWVSAWVLATIAALAGTYLAMRWYRAMASPEHLVALGSSITERALLVWLCCIALPLLYQQRQAQRSEMQALKLNAVTAELKALQAQVEPHFLYNTLANTRYLARHQPERAVEMLDHLIAYLHQALPDMRSRSSDVTRECELARHYLALMAIRFGERLSYDVQVADDAAHAELPPLLLMSLVENAVRHGVEPLPGEVRVEVAAWCEGDVLHVRVTDSGAGPGQAVLGSGVGLRNLRERLLALYGERATFSLTREEALTRAELTLPFTSAAKEST